MNVAFFCSTPYQILLAIHIKRSMYQGDEADIYVLNHFSEAQVVCKNLQGVDLFRRVKFVDCIRFTNSFSSNKIKRLYQKFIIYSKYKTISNQYFDFGKYRYDEVLLTYPDVIIQLGLKVLFKWNPNIKIHMYEDGTGGYSSDILAATVYKKYLNKITGFGKVIDQYDNLMLFMPELYVGETKIPKKKIPFMNKNDNNLSKTVNHVFGYENDLTIDEKIVYLEQPMNHVPRLNEKIKEIIENILVDDYIIKLHPRSKSEEYGNHKIFQKNSVPWEIICLNNDIENKVLISYYSTAGISNKIIFDKEPMIIFLLELEELLEFYRPPENLKLAIDKFRSTYRDPERVRLPKNLTELNQCLSELIKDCEK